MDGLFFFFLFRKHQLIIVGMRPLVIKEVRRLGLRQVREYGTRPPPMLLLQVEQEEKPLAMRNQQDVIAGMKHQKLNEKLPVTIVDGLKLLEQIVELEIKLLT